MFKHLVTRKKARSTVWKEIINFDRLILDAHKFHAFSFAALWREVGRGIVAKELPSSPEIFSPEEDAADSEVGTLTVEAELSEEIATLLQPVRFDPPAKRRKLWPRGVLLSR